MIQLFEKVRVGKKSRLMIIQKHGYTRGDSIYDVHIIQNGFSTVMEYFITIFAVNNNQQIFSFLQLILRSLVEWKDHDFCRPILEILEHQIKGTIK